MNQHSNITPHTRNAYAESATDTRPLLHHIPIPLSAISPDHFDLRVGQYATNTRWRVSRSSEERTKSLSSEPAFNLSISFSDDVQALSGRV